MRVDLNRALRDFPGVLPAYASPLHYRLDAFLSMLLGGLKPLLQCV